MGRSAVHDGGFFLWENDGVQGLRVSGTGYVLHIQSPLFRLPGHPLHQGGLAAAGASFQDQNVRRLSGVDELIVQRIETCRGIRPQIKSDLWFRCHWPTLQYRFYHKVCRIDRGGAAQRRPFHVFCRSNSEKQLFSQPATVSGPLSHQCCTAFAPVWPPCYFAGFTVEYPHAVPRPIGGVRP